MTETVAVSGPDNWAELTGKHRSRLDNYNAVYPHKRFLFWTKETVIDPFTADPVKALHFAILLGLTRHF